MKYRVYLVMLALHLSRTLCRAVWLFHRLIDSPCLEAIAIPKTIAPVSQFSEWFYATLVKTCCPV